MRFTENQLESLRREIAKYLGFTPPLSIGQEFTVEMCLLNSVTVFNLPPEYR